MPIFSSCAKYLYLICDYFICHFLDLLYIVAFRFLYYSIFQCVLWFLKITNILNFLVIATSYIYNNNMYCDSRVKSYQMLNFMSICFFTRFFYTHVFALYYVCIKPSSNTVLILPTNLMNIIDKFLNFEICNFLF